MVTCILLHYAKIMTKFILPAERLSAGLWSVWNPFRSIWSHKLYTWMAAVCIVFLLGFRDVQRPTCESLLEKTRAQKTRNAKVCGRLMRLPTSKKCNCRYPAFGQWTWNSEMGAVHWPLVYSMNNVIHHLSTDNTDNLLRMTDDIHRELAF